MKKLLTALFLCATLAAGRNATACTNFIVTKGASTDSSIMVSYAADSHVLYGALYKFDAPRRPAPWLPVYEWDTGRYLGDISQPATLYSTVGNMNEHQLVIAETTYGGRAELSDSTGRIDYGALMYVTLQRARTAREAIRIIVDLANEYGYASSGESFSIADKNEAWIMEFIGKGCRIENGVNTRRGIVWVARRIPDGYVSGHANQARITTFPLDDPENCLYAPDVVSFAREMGYYDGPDEAFSFCDAYAPLDFSSLRGCEARVWSFFNAVAPQMDRYLEYAMGDASAERLPLWIKPEKKIAPKQVFDAMRDHYEGTPMDMTTDIGAGGHGCPYRWRPMTFNVDGVEYTNERATATQQTGFWFVAQTRSEYPDPIGGILWFGVDDAGTSCLTPIYCCTDRVPACFSEENGHLTEYSPTSAFWLFNRVAQFAYLRYDLIGSEVRAAADAWEREQLAQTGATDREALALYRKNPARAVRFLTDFSVETAGKLFDRWTALDRYLLVKYIDGNVKREDAAGFMDNGHGKHIPASPLQPGYNEKWKRAVAADNGDILRLKD